MDPASLNSSFVACHIYQTKKSRSNLSSKFHHKSELKSSIPRPSPCLRSRESMKVHGSSSYHSQPINFSKIPIAAPFRSAERNKITTSNQRQASSMVSHPSPRQQAELRTPQKRAQTLSRPSSPKTKTMIRPMSAHSAKNPYPNVKAKVNTHHPGSKKLKSEYSPRTVRPLTSNESNVVESKVESSSAASTIGENSTEGKVLSNDEIIEKQKLLLSIYNELKKIQPSKDLQPLDREICRLMVNKTLGQLEGLSRENSSFLNEASPEFLTTFEKQMEVVSESWLRFICDVISTKLLAGNAAMSRLTLPDLNLNVRDELYRFLHSLPADGDPLHAKLQRIEEDQLKMVAVVMHSVMALSKQHEDLKDKHFRLEKTQDQIHFELKEELAILNGENQDLDNKYSLAVEKFNIEKSKTEQQEKHKITIHREIAEIKKIMKIMEGKCMEWETKWKKLETACKTLEVTVRTKDVTYEKEGKQHRDLVNKYNELHQINNKLKSELAENGLLRDSIQMTNNELQDQLTALKATLDENLVKRNELVEEISNKTKKLNETEAELNLIRSYITNNSYGCKDTTDAKPSMHINEFTQEINLRNFQIQELKTKLSHMEHLVKDKSMREEMMMKQVAEMQNKPHEEEVTLRAQIKELQYEIKDLKEERAELEKIIVQKTLELDQRDLLMQEHSQILRARDDLIPMIQEKRRNQKDCIERLSAIVIEHQKTYFNQESDGFFTKEDQNMYEAMKALENRYSFDPKMVEKELSFRQEKMTELFNLLEHKQMEMMKLERRLRELQGIHTQGEMLQKEQQDRICNLQRELTDRKHNAKARGFLSMFSGQEVPPY